MKFPFLLTCQHVTEIDTRSKSFISDERVWCVFCQADSLILTIHLPEWHAFCKDCSFGRWTGQSKETADWHANRHHMRTGHMTVDTEYVDRPANITERDRLRKAGILSANLPDSRDMPRAKAYFPNREPACWLECGHIADWWGAIHCIGDRRSGKAIWTQYCQTHDKWVEIVQDVMPGEYGNPPKRVIARARKGGYIQDSSLF